MSVALPQTPMTVVADFLNSNPTPEQIIDFRLPPALEARAEELFDRYGETGLSQDEQAEMQEFMSMEQLMTIAKAKARLKVSQQV